MAKTGGTGGGHWTTLYIGADGSQAKKELDSVAKKAEDTKNKVNKSGSDNDVLITPKVNTDEISKGIKTILNEFYKVKPKIEVGLDVDKSIENITKKCAKIRKSLETQFKDIPVTFKYVESTSTPKNKAKSVKGSKTSEVKVDSKEDKSLNGLIGTLKQLNSEIEKLKAVTINIAFANGGTVIGNLDRAAKSLSKLNSIPEEIVKTIKLKGNALDEGNGNKLSNLSSILDSIKGKREINISAKYTDSYTTNFVENLDKHLTSIYNKTKNPINLSISGDSDKLNNLASSLDNLVNKLQIVSANKNIRIGISKEALSGQLNEIKKSMSQFMKDNKELFKFNLGITDGQVNKFNESIKKLQVPKIANLSKTSKDLTELAKALKTIKRLGKIKLDLDEKSFDGIKKVAEKLRNEFKFLDKGFNVKVSSVSGAEEKLNRVIRLLRSINKLQTQRIHFTADYKELSQAIKVIKTKLKDKDLTIPIKIIAKIDETSAKIPNSLKSLLSNLNKLRAKRDLRLNVKVDFKSVTNAIKQIDNLKKLLASVKVANGNVDSNIKVSVTGFTTVSTQLESLIKQLDELLKKSNVRIKITQSGGGRGTGGNGSGSGGTTSGSVTRGGGGTTGTVTRGGTQTNINNPSGSSRNAYWNPQTFGDIFSSWRLINEMGRASKGIGSFFEVLSYNLRDLTKLRDSAESFGNITRGGSTLGWLLGSSGIYGRRNFNSIVDRINERRANRGVPELTDSQVESLRNRYDSRNVAGLSYASIGNAAGKLSTAFAGLTALVFTVTGAFETWNILLSTSTQYLSQLVNLVSRALAPGIKLMNEVSMSELALRASFQSMTTVNGQITTAEQATSAVQQLLNRALVDAQKSAFSFGEITEALRGTMGMLFHKGMTAEQAYNITKGVASVAKVSGLGRHQVLQETRDLAQGSITARTSQVANLLGITNEDLAKFKGDQEALYNFLEEKFKHYVQIMEEYSQTPIGAFERLQETIAIAGKTIVEEFGEPVVKVFNALTDSLGFMADDTGKKVLFDDNGDAFYAVGESLDEYGEKVENVSSLHFELSDTLQQVVVALAEVGSYAIEATKGLLEYLLGMTNSKNMTEMFITVTKIMIDVVVGCAKAFIYFSTTLYNMRNSIKFAVSAFYRLYSIIRAVINMLLIFNNMQLSALNGAIEGYYKETDSDVEKVGNIISGAFSGAKDSAITDAKDIVDAIANSLAGKDIDIWGENPQDNLSDDVSVRLDETLKPLSEIQNSLNKIVDEGGIKYKPKDRDSSNVSPSDIHGIKSDDSGKADKAANKRYKEWIKEQQKMLKEILEKLKEELQDKLDALKDILEDNEIAYDEGIKNYDDYVLTKSMASVEKYETELAEKLEERNAIETAGYENELDRQRELHKVDREIESTRKQLEKSVRGLEIIQKRIGTIDESFQSMNNALRRNYNNLMGLAGRVGQIQNSLGLGGLTRTPPVGAAPSTVGVVSQPITPQVVEVEVITEQSQNSFLRAGKNLGISESLVMDLLNEVKNQFGTGDLADKMIKTAMALVSAKRPERTDKNANEYDEFESFLNSGAKNIVSWLVKLFKNSEYLLEGRKDPNISKIAMSALTGEDGVSTMGGTQEFIDSMQKVMNEFTSLGNNTAKLNTEIKKFTIPSPVQQGSSVTGQVSTPNYMEAIYRTPIRGEQDFIPRGRDSTIQKVIAEAVRQNVDVSAALAVAAIESYFNQNITSSAGAIGVMQLMPETAESLGVDPYDEDQNIEGGVRFLKKMIDQFGDIGLGMAAYNAGPGAVQKYGGVPPYGETQNYVQLGKSIIRDLTSNIQSLDESIRNIITQPSIVGYDEALNQNIEGNALRIAKQFGKECTLEAMSSIYNAYTGENTTSRDWSTGGENWWYSNLKGGKLQAKEYNFSNTQRDEYLKTIRNHFDERPNDPILAYMAGGNGSNKINRNSGTHAFVIGRKLSNDEYLVFDSASGTAYVVNINDLFDPTANGGDRLSGMNFGEGNNLFIPQSRPTRPITTWQNETTVPQPVQVVEIDDPNFSDVENNMWRLAHRASDRARGNYGLDINPEMVYRQWWHETGGFTSRLFREVNNLGGLKTRGEATNSPAPDGGYYREFRNLEDSVDTYIDAFIKFRPELSGINNIPTWAEVMRETEYYIEDARRGQTRQQAVEEYIRGMSIPQIPNTSGQYQDSYTHPTSAQTVEPIRIDFTKMIKDWIVEIGAIDKEMRNGTKGCVEALAFMFSDLNSLIDKNEINVTELFKHLRDSGAVIEKYVEGVTKVNAGDTIMWERNTNVKGHSHVVASTGEGYGYVGNSSTANPPRILYGNDFRNMYNDGTLPDYIIRTGVGSDNFRREWQDQSGRVIKIEGKTVTVDGQEVQGFDFDKGTGQVYTNNIHSLGGGEEARRDYEKRTQDYLKLSELKSSLDTSHLFSLESRLENLETQRQRALQEAERSFSSTDNAGRPIKDEYKRLLNLQYDRKRRELESDVLIQQLNYNLEELSRTIEDKSFDVSIGKGDFNSIIRGFTGNVGSANANDVYSPSSQIRELKNLEMKFFDEGDVETAVKIRDTIEDALKKVSEWAEKIIDTTTKQVDLQKSLFDSNPNFTNLQREIGDRQFEAWRNEAIYNQRESLQETYQEQYNERAEEIKRLTEELQKYNEGSKERLRLQQQINDESAKNKNLERLMSENYYLKEQAKLLKEQPSLLKDVEIAGKNAFEDGLVTFLTDGINKAGSLKDALKDMLKNILLSIQKVQAKWVAESISTALFGHHVTQPYRPGVEFVPSFAKDIPSTVPTSFTVQDVNAMSIRRKQFMGSNVINKDLYGNIEEGTRKFRKLTRETEQDFNEAISDLKLLHPDTDIDDFTDDDIRERIAFNRARDGKQPILVGNELTQERFEQIQEEQRRKIEELRGHQPTGQDRRDALDGKLKVGDYETLRELQNQPSENGTNLTQTLTSIDTKLQTLNDKRSTLEDSINERLNTDLNYKDSEKFATDSRMVSDYNDKINELTEQRNQTILEGVENGEFTSPEIKSIQQQLSEVNQKLTEKYNQQESGFDNQESYDTPFSGGETPNQNLDALKTEIGTLEAQQSQLKQQLLTEGNKIATEKIKNQEVQPQQTTQPVTPQDISQINQTVQSGSENIIQKTDENGTRIVEAVGNAANTISQSQQPMGSSQMIGNNPGGEGGIPQIGSGNPNPMPQSGTLGNSNVSKSTPTTAYPTTPQISQPEQQQTQQGDTGGFISSLFGNIFGSIGNLFKGIFGFFGKLFGGGKGNDKVVPQQNADNSQLYASISQILSQLTNIYTLLQSKLTLIDNHLINIHTAITELSNSLMLAAGGGDVNNVPTAATGGVITSRGVLRGPGTGTSDSIPTMLSNGEGIIKAERVRQLGANFIHAVNSGNFAKIRSTIPHFADGGVLGNASVENTARGISSFAQGIGSHISSTNKFNIALVRDEQEAMREFMRGGEGQRIMLDFSKRNAAFTSRISKSF